MLGSIHSAAYSAYNLIELYKETSNPVTECFPGKPTHGDYQLKFFSGAEVACDQKNVFSRINNADDFENWFNARTNLPGNDLQEFLKSNPTGILHFNFLQSKLSAKELQNYLHSGLIAKGELIKKEQLVVYENKND